MKGIVVMIPKVSVIMPAYNSEKTIEEAILSVNTICPQFRIDCCK